MQTYDRCEDPYTDYFVFPKETVNLRGRLLTWPPVFIKVHSAISRPIAVSVNPVVCLTPMPNERTECQLRASDAATPLAFMTPSLNLTHLVRSLLSPSTCNTAISVPVRAQWAYPVADPA